MGAGPLNRELTGSGRVDSRLFECSDVGSIANVSGGAVVVGGEGRHGFRRRADFFGSEKVVGRKVGLRTEGNTYLWEVHWGYPNMAMGAGIGHGWVTRESSCLTLMLD